MRFQQFLIPIACVAGVAAAYRAYGWAGVAIAASALVMWLLLHFTRLMAVLQRAAKRPVGSVDSAVMFHARLHPGMTLLHLVAMTRSLGELRSEKQAQPEIYRWTDGTQSHVTCELVGGKLRSWTLERPPAA